MRTKLDSARTWFLESLSYSEELSLVLVEGFVNSKAEILIVGKARIDGAHQIAPSTKSRRYCITFHDFVTWQVVRENCSMFDKSEIKEDDGKFVQTISKSRYLDYAKAVHVWGPTTEKTCMYRVWSEEEVIEVISCQPPKIVAVRPNPALKRDGAKRAAP